MSHSGGDIKKANAMLVYLNSSHNEVFNEVSFAVLYEYLDICAVGFRIIEMILRSNPFVNLYKKMQYNM